MVKKVGSKCLAKTLKHPNAKRSTEEFSQCTRFSLPNSRFCDNHQDFNILTDEELLSNTKLCRGCKKHRYYSDMGVSMCENCLKRGNTNREIKREKKVSYPPCIICNSIDGSERVYPDYCNKHKLDGKKKDIESRGFKWCKNIIRGCPDPELTLDYPYDRCDICREKYRSKDQMNINRKEYMYRRSAKDRGFSYNLTFEQCEHLFKGTCFYCGHQSDSGYLNGIDRLDNDIGYTTQNCVTCCSICNYMKRRLKPTIFINMCEHILTYIGRINGTLRPQIFQNFHVNEHHGTIFGIYKYGAKEKKREWSLSFEQFTEIIRQPCYLCGKISIPSGHSNGIDRYDSGIGYTIQNCRPCCGNCNYMKFDSLYDTFISKLLQIYENNHVKELSQESLKEKSDKMSLITENHDQPVQDIMTQEKESVVLIPKQKLKISIKHH